MSIAYKHRTGNVNVLILDLLGKSQSDFDIFKNQPFLSAPVITEPDTARKIILLLYQERTRRMKDPNLPDMPYIVCVIDEFPRLCSGISNKEYAEQIEAAMNELLSSSRHTKIHLELNGAGSTESGKEESTRKYRKYYCENSIKVCSLSKFCDNPWESRS